MIPVTIKGPKIIVDAIFVLDTGATYTVINTEILFKAGYKRSDFLEKITTTTATKCEEVNLMKISSLGALGLVRRNFKIITKELPITLFVDGLLGLDFYRNKELHINFRNGIINLE